MKEIHLNNFFRIACKIFFEIIDTCIDISENYRLYVSIRTNFIFIYCSTDKRILCTEKKYPGCGKNIYLLLLFLPLYEIYCFCRSKFQVTLLLF